MARLDFNDLEQRRAYRRELRAVARPWRWMGISLILCGAGVALVRGEGFDPLSLLLVAAGWATVIGVIMMRHRHHIRRMAEDGAGAT